MTTKTYRYLPADTGWVCTAPNATAECHGTVLKVETRHDGHDIYDGIGVCQRQSHRGVIAHQVETRGFVLEPDGATVATVEFPFVADIDIERTEMNLDQNALQRRLYDYLHDPDSSYRMQALRELEANGAFEDSQDVARTRELVEAYYAAQPERGTFCAQGLARFKAAILDEQATVPTLDSSAPILGGVTGVVNRTSEHTLGARYDAMTYVTPPHGSWGCTEADGHCLGTNTRIALRRTDGVWFDTQFGVCQWIAHRQANSENIREQYRARDADPADPTTVITFADAACDEDVPPLIVTRPATEEAPVPDTPTLRPFFADQRHTYTLAELNQHLDVPADTEFVPATALVEAIKEYRSQYDLCRPGVTAFLDEFGLSLRQRFTVAMTDTSGDRVDILEFSALSDDEPDSGSMDDYLNDALDRFLESHFGDADLEITRKLDCYVRTEED